ncbi:translation initiation factor IF-3 [Candidatus Falkowbacteria bacterium CG10_big_fil_rev_8_21_14_0_10_39_11]|uniref:Translation initiation factor IF-3 n=1 Tax=Candidatus Falkowbacteria bacterium CG10_big_fil_rev_8_21_14_0_10_39_11 TaxID=1974565 RepID=A0A2H0V405_9BACT|nr:MAG: translation initiation factor IF-3 [Candidatus Falkowbacteria bacterium CG10_big_fil_rev_8_21_14_0_10_39_11]
MRKSYKFAKKKKSDLPNYKTNKQIRSETVTVIDFDGSFLGEMNTYDAIKKAEDQGFDLVEVNPNATPPVVKIIDYGGFKYKQEKIVREQKKKIKKVETKGIRLSAKISEHDMETRIKQTEKFLGQGHKIKIELILRGRENQHGEKAGEVIKTFISKLSVPNTLEQTTSRQGNKLFAIISPENNN